MTTSMEMDKDQSRMTGRILNLTLEIIYLLTGERFPFLLTGDQMTITVPCASLNLEGHNRKKVLDVTYKMIGLLTGEVPIRCQDVSVYFSMEEWEYLEGHKDLYKDIVMMEDQPPLTSPDGSSNRNPPERCPRPLDSTQEGRTTPHHDQGKDLRNIKVEDEVEETYVMYDQQYTEEAGMMGTFIEEETPTEISTDHPAPRHSLVNYFEGIEETPVHKLKKSKRSHKKDKRGKDHFREHTIVRPNMKTRSSTPAKENNTLGPEQPSFQVPEAVVDVPEEPADSRNCMPMGQICIMVRHFDEGDYDGTLQHGCVPKYRKREIVERVLAEIKSTYGVVLTKEKLSKKWYDLKHRQQWTLAKARAANRKLYRTRHVTSTALGQAPRGQEVQDEIDQPTQNVLPLLATRAHSEEPQSSTAGSLQRWLQVCEGLSQMEELEKSVTNMRELIKGLKQELEWRK